MTILNRSYKFSQRTMIWYASIISLTVTLADQNVTGQEEAADDNISSITLNDATADQIVRSLEILIEQNDSSARSAVFSSYISMMAFLVGLALVIFGLQLSRGEKIFPTARKFYKILILALLLPVVLVFIYGISPLSRAGLMHSDYLGVASLLMIPTVAVLVLMASKLHDKL